MTTKKEILQEIRNELQTSNTGIMIRLDHLNRLDHHITQRLETNKVLQSLLKDIFADQQVALRDIIELLKKKE